jgi:hypothetical protein
LEQLHLLLSKGLQATAALWEPVQSLYHWIYALVEVLNNEQEWPKDKLEEHFAKTLTSIQEQAETSPCLQPALTHLLKVARSYQPHLFFCYQVGDLPRTNNDLEQAFGRVRAHERRATGRKGAIPALVVRGAVRVQAALASQILIFTPEQLTPSDIQVWRSLRNQVADRQETRRQQLRFRKDPATFLSHLEAELLKESLRF